MTGPFLVRVLTLVLIVVGGYLALVFTILGALHVYWEM